MASRVWSFLFFLLGTSFSTGFNLDVKHVITIKLPETVTKGTSSSFGFSLAFYTRYFYGDYSRSSKNAVGLLVGAPFGPALNSSSGERSGAAYFCPVRSGEPDTCERLQLEQGAYSTDVTNDYEDGTTMPSVSEAGTPYLDHSLMGFTVVTQPKKPFQALICAPGTARFLQKASSLLLVRGACYLMPQKTGGLCGSSRWLGQEISASVATEVVNRLDYDDPRFGVSVHFSAEDQAKVIGLPGSASGLGASAHDVNSPEGASPINLIQVFRNPGSNHTGKSDPYFGYSIASGNLFGNGTTYYLAGMPRAALTGMVAVYLPPKVENAWDAGAFADIKFYFRGTQAFEGFGQSVVALDLNSDRRDDVVVGAPNHIHQYIDGGAVYIFQSSSNWEDAEFEGIVSAPMQLIRPQKGFGNRFGTSLVSLGDLNRDGYKDFAAGAPFGSSGGFAAVFFGGPDGYNPELTEFIVSTNGTQAFGFALAPGVGPNALSSYGNDLAVGDFLDERVYIYRSRPVVRWTTKMVFEDGTENLQTIDLSRLGNQNLVVKPCFRGRWDKVTRMAPSEGSMSAVLTILNGYHTHSPSGSKHARAVFDDTGNHSVAVNMVLRSSGMKGGHLVCFDPLNVKIFQPMVWSYETARTPLTVSVVLAHESSASTFCERCLVTSPDSKLNASSTFVFARCRGTDAVVGCKPNLTVTAPSTHNNQSLRIMDSVNNTFTVDFDLANAEDSVAAYAPTLIIGLPANSRVVEVSSVVSGNQSIYQNCAVLPKTPFANETLLEANWILCKLSPHLVGEVFLSPSRATISVTFHVHPVSFAAGSPRAKRISFRAGHRILESANDTLDWTNVSYLNVELWSGFSRRIGANRGMTSTELKPNFMDNKARRRSVLGFQVAFDVTSDGPGSAPRNEVVEVAIPMACSNVSLFSDVSMELACPQKTSACWLARGGSDQVAKIPLDAWLQLYPEANSTSSALLTTSLNLNCDDPWTACHIFHCDLPQTPAGQTCQVKATVELVRESFRVKTLTDSLVEILIESSARLIRGRDVDFVRDYSDISRNSAKVSTKITAYYAVSGAQKWPVRLMIMSGITSVAVLIFVAVVLHVKGFFRRYRPEIEHIRARGSLVLPSG